MLVEIIFLALGRLLLFNKARYLHIRRHSVCLPRIIDLFLFFDRRNDLRLHTSTHDSRKRIPLYLLRLLLFLLLNRRGV